MSSIIYIFATIFREVFLRMGIYYFEQIVFEVL